jgi:ATP-dependent 26S proteasome regulatory subunit
LGRPLCEFAKYFVLPKRIDEIDAVGRKRGLRTDVGELDRIVISLMQQLELVAPIGIIVAASNIPKELDAALLRRFDLALEFPAPTTQQLRHFARTEAAKRSIKLSNGVRHELASARTYAETEQILDTAHRRILLHEV